MGYKKVQSVPSIMIDYQYASLFQCLSKDEKEIVWDAIMNYVDVARQKDATNIEPFLQDGLSKVAYKVFDGMLNSIDTGFTMYWKSCEKNSERAKKRWEKQKEDTTVYHSIPQDAEKKGNDMNRNDMNNNITSYPSYVQQILKSDSKDEFIRIINHLQNAGFSMTDEYINEVARKMKFELLDETTALHCIDVCKRRGNITFGGFMKSFNKIVHEGYDNRVV